MALRVEGIVCLLKIESYLMELNRVGTPFFSQLTRDFLILYYMFNGMFRIKDAQP